MASSLIEEFKKILTDYKEYSAKHSESKESSKPLYAYYDKKEQKAKSIVRHKAAVLVPFLLEDGILKIIITERSPKISMYPKEMSFPGGRTEESDQNIVETALREAQEEIGLPRDNVEIIGTIEDVQKHSRKKRGSEERKFYTVSCVIGFIKENFTPVLDKNEVSEIFNCPVRDLLNVEMRKFKAVDMPVCKLTVKDKTCYIYGFTHMIAILICKLFDLVPQEKQNTLVQTVQIMKKFQSPRMDHIFNYCIQRDTARKPKMSSNL